MFIGLHGWCWPIDGTSFLTCTGSERAWFTGEVGSSKVTQVIDDDF